MQNDKVGDYVQVKFKILAHIEEPALAKPVKIVKLAPLSGGQDEKKNGNKPQSLLQSLS